MRRALWIAAALILSAVAISAPKPKNHAEKKFVVKSENQFVTVEEFVKAKRAVKTPVSVEGYIVLGMKAKLGTRISLVDSTDHVLVAKEADAAAKSGATATVPASKKPGLAWSAKGLQRFVMFTGSAKAQKQLHDTVAKVRITGLTTSSRTISASKVEYTDDNGDWKTL